jgi:phage gpG-like protein
VSATFGGVSISDTLSPSLAKKIRALEDPRPVLEAMGLQLLSLTARSFNDPSVRVMAWAPLKPKTIAEKIKAGKSTAILKRDVILARSFRMTNLTKRSVQIGTDRKYAATHQFGSAKKRIPARPMLPFVGSNPATATLAPIARLKIQKIGQAKLDSLLKQ